MSCKCKSASYFLNERHILLASIRSIKSSILDLSDNNS